MIFHFRLGMSATATCVIALVEGMVLEHRSYHSSRRGFLGVSTNLALLPLVPLKSLAAAVDATPTRDIDVGGGFDILSPSTLKDKDVVYPKSMEGSWQCERVPLKVDGDLYQAETAYKCLGGRNLQAGKMETFMTKYTTSPLVGASDFVVLDRGFEIASRTESVADLVQWNVNNPDSLQYGSPKVILTVVRRSVEPPTDQGFGFDELIRVEDRLVTRAVQVKRRYRRSFDADGNRVVEGLEIVKTFRVLDGIAGTEFPTSTIKSQLRFTRPL